jgi:hypothetical protein
MRTNRGLLAAVFSLALGSTASATTYQVGPGKTYTTLNSVASLLGPGDLVEIDGNNTYAGGVVLAKSGTAASKITIRGVRVGGKRPVFSGGTNTLEVQGNHVVLEGLELTAASFRCYFHHGDDITLRDSVIHDCPRHGVLGADSDSGSLLMEYDEVYKCGGGTQDHQIYMATDEVAHPGSVFRMQHCYVHDGNGGNNVKSRAERNEIYYNWLEGAFYHELELIGPDGTTENLKREDSDVVGNVLWQRNAFYVTRFGGDGTGQTNGRYRFVNNTVIVQPGGSSVFRLFDGLESVQMHNNVFFAIGGGAMNLKREVEASWSTGSAVIAGTNNWFPTGSTNVPTQWSGSITGTDPGFVSLSAPDVRLTAGSPLINAGNPSTMDPVGYAFPNPQQLPLNHPPTHAVGAIGSAEARPVVGTIDLGAFEFGSASSDAGVADAGASGGGAGGGAGAGGGTAAGGGSGGSTGTGGGAAAGGGGGATGSGGGDATGGGTGGTGGGGSGIVQTGGCTCSTLELPTFALVALLVASARARRRR